MIVNPDVDVYSLRAKKTQQYSEKRKTQQPIENQKNTKYQNAS